MADIQFASVCAYMRSKVDAHVVEETYNDDKYGIIDALCDWFGIARKSSYCAMALVRGLYLSGCKLGSEFPKTAGSQAIKAWAKKNDRLFTDPQHLLECEGAFGGWTNVGDTAHGHVFCIEKRLTNVKGQVVAIQTLEANTTPQAGTPNAERDGGGFYERRRNVYTGSNIWFVDLTGVKGGSWWVNK